MVCVKSQLVRSLAPGMEDVARVSMTDASPRLSLGTMFCYAHFQLSITALFAFYPSVRGFVYRDTLKMSLGTLSWILVVVKCLDLATGQRKLSLTLSLTLSFL